MSNKISILVDAVTKKAQENLDGVNKSIEGLGDEAQETNKKNANFNEGMQSVATKAGVVIAALLAVGAAAKKGFEFAEEGAQVLRLETAFDSMASSVGTNSEYMLSKLSEAAQGTINNTSLMLSANRAMMLGVTNDADEMANLLEIAAFRGRAMGLSTEQAFNDIVTGVGRASPLILDNLGIVINASETYEKYADSLGITADELTEAQKKEALLTRVLEDGNSQLEEAGGLALDAASGFEHLKAASSNLSDELKTRGAPTIGALSEAYAGVIDEQAKYLRDLRLLSPAQRELADSIALSNNGMIDAAGLQDAMVVIQNQTSGAIDSATRSYIAWGNSVDVATAATEGSFSPMDGLTSKYGDLLSVTRDVSKEMISYDEKQDDLIEKSYGLQTQIINATKEFGAESRQVAELNQKLFENEEKMDENTANFEMNTNRRILKRVEEILAADGLEVEEQKALIDRGVAMGVYTEEHAVQAKKVIDDSHNMAAEITAAIASIPDHKIITITTMYESIGDIEAWKGVGYASGTDGWETVPSGFPNDTYPISLTSGEKFAVIPANESIATASIPFAPSAQGSGGGTSSFVYAPTFSTGNRDEMMAAFAEFVDEANRMNAGGR